VATGGWRTRRWVEATLVPQRPVTNGSGTPCFLRLVIGSLSARYGRVETGGIDRANRVLRSVAGARPVAVFRPGGRRRGHGRPADKECDHVLYNTIRLTGSGPCARVVTETVSPGDTHMTIMLDIRPEVQAELARQAAAQGRAIEAVATDLLEEAVHIPVEAPAKPPAKDMLELFAPLRGLNIDFERDRDPGRDLQL